MMGKIMVTVEEAPPHPYSSKAEPPWLTLPARLGDNAPTLRGGARIAEAFRLVESRSARRRRERERAMLPRRPRYRSPERTNLDGPPPKGWHVKGDCPECR